MEKISKNCYKGELITNPNEIYRLAIEKKSVYTPNWGVKPAAVLLSMQFRIIMRLINDKKLWYTVKQHYAQRAAAMPSWAILNTKLST